MRSLAFGYLTGLHVDMIQIQSYSYCRDCIKCLHTHTHTHTYIYILISAITD